MKKKLLIAGRIYDTALMGEKEIEAQVQNDLNDYVGIDKVKFGLHMANGKITLVFIRFIEYQEDDLEQGLMKDADAYMVTGEGYNGFSMPIHFPTIPFGRSPYLMEQSEFKRAYKESAEILADKIDWMKIEVKPYSVVIRLK